MCLPFRLYSSVIQSYFAFSFCDSVFFSIGQFIFLTFYLEEYSRLHIHLFEKFLHYHVFFRFLIILTLHFVFLFSSIPRSSDSFSCFLCNYHSNHRITLSHSSLNYKMFHLHLFVSFEKNSPSPLILNNPLLHLSLSY